MATGRVVVNFAGVPRRPDFQIIRSLFRFGLPAGVQGVAMNVAGVLLLRFMGSLDHSAEAQAAYAVCYTELFAFITWTSVGLMGAAASIAGQNLGAGRPERSIHAVQVAARFGLMIAATSGLIFLLFSRQLLGMFGLHDPIVVGLGQQLLRYLSLSGLFVTVALTYTGGLQGTGDTRSPLFITLVAQIVVPLGPVLLPAGHRPSRRIEDLAGDRPRSFHALRALGRAVPPGQVAADRNRTYAPRVGRCGVRLAMSGFAWAGFSRTDAGPPEGGTTRLAT